MRTCLLSSGRSPSDTRSSSTDAKSSESGSLSAALPRVTPTAGKKRELDVARQGQRPPSLFLHPLDELRLVRIRVERRGKIGGNRTRHKYHHPQCDEGTYLRILFTKRLLWTCDLTTGLQGRLRT